MSGHVKNFKVKDKKNKLMLLCTGDDQLLQKYKTICTKIKDVKDIELNALQVYDDRYIKTKVKTCVIKLKLILTTQMGQKWYRMWIFHD